MEENISQYTPQFPGEPFSERDLHYLEPFASNPKGLISALTNLPPEIVGALCSRASRAKNSLLRVLLDEYLYPIIDGEDKALAAELEDTVKFFKHHGFKNILNNQRAQSFYAKWLSQYGDDSIAQMTGTHVVFWGISQVALKFIEDRRLGLEPIEKSTRYVNFGNKISDHYLYYTPTPDLEKLGLLTEYQKTLNQLFDTYVELLPPLLEWLKKNFDDKESILEKKAFDTLRGLLPMATLGQVAFRGNAQAFEYLLSRTLKHPLGELRWIAQTLKTELDKEIPSLLLRLTEENSQGYQDYLVNRGAKVRAYLKTKQAQRSPVPTRDSDLETGTIIHPVAQPEVKLVEFDPEAENKIIASIIFPETHESYEKIYLRVKSMSTAEKAEVLENYTGGRKARWYKVGRPFENSYVRFEIVMDAGAYRDLHRHRIMTQDRQMFSTHHGYHIPKEIEEAGFTEKFIQPLEAAKLLFDKLERIDPELAQYVVPLAYRLRFYQYQNLRQAFWETELRTISQGHPDYRLIEQKKYELLKEKFPLIAKYMLVDMADYAIARRGTEEGIKKKEESLVEKLKNRS
ncbi:MAG: FAD-dependent thymidylate synthase [Candidatus Liptonbacteria bacterium]|nr:FAD-dependent thymidylate synthase [Candidatus Liptonbacteria bacterium]